jgi:hypothetical protein
MGLISTVQPLTRQQPISSGQQIGVCQMIESSPIRGCFDLWLRHPKKSGFSNFQQQGVQQPVPADRTILRSSIHATNDGTNRIIWNPAKSAAGYHIERFTLDLSTVLCLSAPACNPSINGLSAGTTQYDDSRSDVDPSTRFSYGVHSYNATGFGPQRAAKPTLTQRPIAPTLTKTSSPTPDSLNTTMSWNHTAGTWCVPGAYTGTGGEWPGYQQFRYGRWFRPTRWH